MANWEDMYPCKTPLENKIKLLLVMRGYPRGKICFRSEERRVGKECRCRWSP